MGDGADDTTELRIRDDHEELLHRLRERAEVACRQAVKQGLCEPVVLIMDLQDKLAHRLLAGTGSKEQMWSTIRQAERRGVRPAVNWHVPGNQTHVPW